MSITHGDDDSESSYCYTGAVAVTTDPTIGWLRHVFLPPSESFIAGALQAVHGHGVRIEALSIVRRSAAKFPWPHLRVLADSPRGWLDAALYWTTGWSPRQDAWARKLRIIHAHMGYTGVHALGAARRHRIPLVTSFYGLDVALSRSPVRFLPAFLPYALLRRRLFRRGDRFLVLSRHMHAELVEQGCPADKLRTVRLGIDVDRFARPRRPHAGPLRVLMVGREVEKKGFDDGLRACARARAGGLPLRVTVLGTGDAHRSALVRLAAALALPVDWPDPRTDVAAAMTAADVLLVPSRTAANGDQEGTPTVICEGSAAGLPVISTRHAGIPEQVEHGVSGLLVDERDVDAMAAALVHLATDPERRAAFGLAGRAKMKAEYSISAARAALLDVYRELLS